MHIEINKHESNKITVMSHLVLLLNNITTFIIAMRHQTLHFLHHLQSLAETIPYLFA